MAQKFDSCVRKVKRKISQGKIKKTYKCGKKRCKSNPYSICSKSKKLYVESDEERSQKPWEKY